MRRVIGNNFSLLECFVPLNSSSAERRLVPNPDVNPDSKAMNITILIGYELVIY